MTTASLVWISSVTTRERVPFTVISPSSSSSIRTIQPSPEVLVETVEKFSLRR